MTKAGQRFVSSRLSYRARSSVGLKFQGENSAGECVDERAEQREQQQIVSSREGRTCGLELSVSQSKSSVELFQLKL